MPHDASWKETGEWADDNLQTWDQETGAPTKMHFASAVQVWDMMRGGGRPATVAEAAAVFNVPGARVIEAVQEHPWMLVTGPLDDYSKAIIEHDGE